MRLVLLSIALGTSALAATRSVRHEPFHAELRSGDSTREVLIHVRLHGSAFALGARRVPGGVQLAGDTGSVVTPAILEVGDAPGEIVMETSATSPELVVRPESGAGALDVYARGHSVVVVRDSSGQLRVVSATIRSLAR